MIKIKHCYLDNNHVLCYHSPCSPPPPSLSQPPPKCHRPCLTSHQSPVTNHQPPSTSVHAQQRPQPLSPLCFTSQFPVYRGVGGSYPPNSHTKHAGTLTTPFPSCLCAHFPSHWGWGVRRTLPLQVLLSRFRWVIPPTGHTSFAIGRELAT